ncbi:MAG: cbb3-type cytochrome c oxidase subunit 3 [Rubrimonas sp.]
METYDAMRHFADSWGLLAMVIVFLVVVARVLFLPGARRNADDAARIPFKDYADKTWAEKDRTDG